MHLSSTVVRSKNIYFFGDGPVKLIFSSPMNHSITVAGNENIYIFFSVGIEGQLSFFKDACTIVELYQ